MEAQAVQGRPKQSRAAQISSAILCGVINTMITIPIMTSFTAIIFHVSHASSPLMHYFISPSMLRTLLRCTWDKCFVHVKIKISTVV